ncbi:MAG: hypothetical protein KF725_07570 [Cyclobacteriaceae bacterium]|nr:hypothetical protein [Cyclobacteriaceae bacterium]UYN88217.1 MAG: hypothetical protein KIT51_08235 [Cyclobacteriaceae bacterium]
MHTLKGFVFMAIIMTCAGLTCASNSNTLLDGTLLHSSIESKNNPLHSDHILAFAEKTEEDSNKSDKQYKKSFRFKIADLNLTPVVLSSLHSHSLINPFHWEFLIHYHHRIFQRYEVFRI